MLTVAKKKTVDFKMFGVVLEAIWMISGCSHSRDIHLDLSMVVHTTASRYDLL